MATYEVNTLIKVYDKRGNCYKQYPKTKVEQVIGLVDEYGISGSVGSTTTIQSMFDSIGDFIKNSAVSMSNFLTTFKARLKNNNTTTEEGYALDARMGKTITEVRTATLDSLSWTDTAPYTQTITVNGMTANYSPIISCGKPDTLSSSSYKELHKSYAMIDRAVTGTNSITFYCYSKKPIVSIPLFIKGV